MKKDMVFLFIVLGGFFVSCTSGFREFNTDLAGITDEDLKVDNNDHGIRLGIIQQGIYFNYDYGKGKNWPFQLIQNLNADMFSGYMHDAKPLNGGSHNSDYNLQVGTVRCGDIRMLMFSLRSTSRNNLPVPGNRLFSV